MTDLVGRKLKGFYVLRRLGRGAMAEVYLAQQLSLGRRVALKVLNEALALDPSYVRRFHHEACAAAALVHGGIVQIYEVGEEDGIHYIAQEYVAGRNLGELIRSHGSLAPRITLDILRQVAAALEKASSEGIVHRDIKPENIMLARTGEVKVADFGLARLKSDQPGGGLNLTQVGVTMGTPLYMSPEQIEGREVDSRSDIYSLGVTAYHMLSGVPPFKGDSPLAVALQHLNQPTPPLPPADDFGAGSRLHQIVARMMAKKPADRYPDPADLLDDLNSLATSLGRESPESYSAASSGSAASPPSALIHRSSSLAELLHVAEEREQTTNRLDDAMKTMALARSARPPYTYRWIAAAIVGGAALGATIGAAKRSDVPLAGVHTGPPRSANVWEQIYHASTVDTEKAWLAVIDFFPEAGTYYHNLAKQGLVYHYLTRTADYGKAVKLLQEMTDGSQPSLRAFGLAGLVVANCQLGDDEQAYLANQQLSTEMRALLEDQMPRMSALLNESLDELADRAL